MGLYVESLEDIPLEAKRDYFIYLLDYGWDEPLGEALRKNYDNMVTIAAENKSVIVRGTNRIHFEDEVLSWHHINGESTEEILPAILITNRHPSKFKENFRSCNNIENDLKLILIPLKKFCKNTTDVVSLIQKLFNDIRSQKDLNDFRISKEIKKNHINTLADALILEPNFAGLGINLKKIMEYIK